MLSRIQSRAIDQFAMEVLGIPGIVLMENAGRGCAEVLWHQLYGVRSTDCGSNREVCSEGFPSLAVRFSHLAPDEIDTTCRKAVVICCGPGNNGGDGFVIARHLSLAGVSVKVVLVADRKRYRGDALTNLRIIENLKLELIDGKSDWNSQQWLDCIGQVQGDSTSWIVDALLGTGAQGALSGPMKDLVEAINLAPAKRCSVDLPTGLDCDTGQHHDLAVRADLTCTFVAPKLGFSNPAAAEILGRVVVVGIGTVAALG